MTNGVANPIPSLGQEQKLSLFRASQSSLLLLYAVFLFQMQQMPIL